MSIQATAPARGGAVHEPPPPAAVGLPTRLPSARPGRVKGVETRCCHSAQGTPKGLTAPTVFSSRSGEFAGPGLALVWPTGSVLSVAGLSITIFTQWWPRRLWSRGRRRSLSVQRRGLRPRPPSRGSRSAYTEHAERRGRAFYDPADLVANSNGRALELLNGLMCFTAAVSM